MTDQTQSDLARLTADLERIREAAKPIVRWIEEWDTRDEWNTDDFPVPQKIVGDLRALRAAVQGVGENAIHPITDDQLAVIPQHDVAGADKLPALRCDICDNGIDPDWNCCPWCGPDEEASPRTAAFTAMRKALEPFAHYADTHGPDSVNFAPDACPIVASPHARDGARPNMGDCRSARAALAIADKVKP